MEKHGLMGLWAYELPLCSKLYLPEGPTKRSAPRSQARGSHNPDKPDQPDIRRVFKSESRDCYTSFQSPDHRRLSAFPASNQTTLVLSVTKKNSGAGYVLSAHMDTALPSPYLYISVLLDKKSRPHSRVSLFFLHLSYIIPLYIPSLLWISSESHLTTNNKPPWNGPNGLT